MKLTFLRRTRNGWEIDMTHKQIRIFSRRNLLRPLLVALLCTTSSVEAASFQDADDMAEAAGMMENRMVDARIFQKECSSRRPELKNEIQDHLAAWQQADALEMRKANYYWSVMGSQHPEETKKLNDAMSQAAVSILNDVSHHGSDEESLALFCKKYFESISSWRKRTPKMYQYLLQIPEGRNR